MTPFLKYATLTLLILQNIPLLAEERPGLRQALAEGDATVRLNYRFEGVEEDSFGERASASTLRTTVSYGTKRYRGFSLFLEAENVTDLGAEGQHNNAGAGSLGNGIRGRPVIADPEITEVNQAFLRLERGKTQVDLGRQQIAFGDQRFVGPVGWRQNHQSFDALLLQNRNLEKATFTYGFIENANRIFGDNKDMSSHLLNVAIDLPFGALSLYGYLLDYGHPSDARLSTSSVGFELEGKRPVGGADILFELEYAEQSDYEDNPGKIDAGYLHLLVGGSLPALKVSAGLEVLEGSRSAGAFATPLATLHKFNGWADKFLATPADGLEDLYLQLSGKHGSLAWVAAFHEFSADSVNRDYGTELDLQLTYRTAWEQLFGIKAALYDADTFSSDTEKLWLWTSYTF